MIVFPPCKINLGLNVISKREDGFHNLESVFYPVPLCDILEVIKLDSFSFTSSGVEIPGDAKNNIVIKAYELLLKDFNLSPVRIHLHKVIPTGAGVGGGSSDASSALMVLNSLFGLNLSDDQLMNYALQLGSDCPFFIMSKPAFVTGRGERLKPIEVNLSGKYLVMINPRIHIPTGKAFANITLTGSSCFNENDFLKPVEAWKTFLFNCFEEYVFSEYPDVKKIKEDLYSQGALFASMSGSGSTVFGIFEDQPTITTSDNYFVFSGKL